MRYGMAAKLYDDDFAIAILIHDAHLPSRPRL